MPYDIQWKKNGAYRRFYGSITGQEVIDMTKMVFSDQNYKNLQYIISDYLGVTQSSMTIDEASIVAHLCHDAAKLNAKLKVAMVVSNENLQALGALVGFELEHFETPWEAEFFSSESEAVQWVS